VALVNNTALLSGNCPLPNAAVIDFVGYGNAVCFETAAIATPTNFINSISRINNGCTDNDNNSTDFSITTPSPRNSRLAGHTCNGTSIAITSVTPNPFCIDAATGAQGNVYYSANGTFANSTFRAVLSDVNGSFSFPVVLGSAEVSGTNPSGVIDITVPRGIASGTSYKIQIEASNPPVLSAPTAVFEIINGVKNVLPNQFKAAANNTTMTLLWTNPSGCFDELMVVAKEGGSINGVPSGDGSAYTADPDFKGSGTPFDGGKVVYKGTVSGPTVTNLTNGTTYFFKIFTRRGTTWSSGTEASDKPRIVPLPGEIVINQLSPQYTSRTLDEYIELVNLTGKAFDLSDLIIRVKNGSGANVVAGASLSGIIQPHSYWLILPLNTSTITVGQTVNVSADTRMDMGFSNTNNQVALVRKTDNAIIDAVGYGSISVPDYTEGAAAVNPPSTGGLKRVVSGADNNNNRTDFAGVANAAIELRNSGSRLANSGAAIAAGTYTVLEVTGNAALAGPATLTGKVVLTNGIFSLQDNHLSTPAINNGNNTRYIKTNGNGALGITSVNGSVLFPVGNSTYNPVTVNNSDNLSWSAHVTDGITPEPTPFNKEAAVNRTWNIMPATAPSATTLVFEYNDADPAQIGSQFNKNAGVVVWNQHAGAWKTVTNLQTPVAVPQGRKAVTVSDHTQFSPFVITNFNAALPVHFVHFKAREKGAAIELEFTNAAEKNVTYYRIERSVDAHHFEPLAQLDPKRNNGSSVMYTWLDSVPPAGSVWYRVMGLEEDGTVTYTPVLRMLVRQHTKPLTIHPNPAQGRTVTWEASLPQGTYLLQLTDGNGRQVVAQQFSYSGGNCIKTLHLPAHLQPGIYYLQLRTRNFIRHQSFVLL
jgi:hypothetical protein